MHKLTHRATVATTLILIATMLPAVAVPTAPPAAATGESAVNTGITGSPVKVEATPPGLGVIVGTGVDGEPTVIVRQPGGTVTDLGEGDAPSFWLGDASNPVLVGTVTERPGSNLNNDGDVDDTVLATSANGTPFLPIVGAPVTLDVAVPVLRCLTRINASIGVACLSESTATDDANNDGDFADLELVLIHDDGSFEFTGQFIRDTPYDISPIRLPDGSVGIGPARVMPNGAISIVTAVADAYIQALLGTSLVVWSSSANATYLVSAVGAPIAVGAVSSYQVGTAVWVQYLEGTTGLCRLHADGTTACFGLWAIWSVNDFQNAHLNVIPLGDDSAVVIGRAPADNPKEARVYRVLPGQAAQFLGLASNSSFALSDGSALTGGMQISSSTVRFYAGRFSVDLGDGRALMRRTEVPGVDLNADGDTTDEITHLLGGSTSRNLSVSAVTGISIGGPGVLLAVDEANGGDMNNDGDDHDVVAAIYDGQAVRSLHLAVSPSGGNPQQVYFVWTGGNTALIGVSEASHGQDLDGDGSATGIVTFEVGYQPVPQQPTFNPTTPTRLLDTRIDGPQTGYTGAKPTAGSTIEVSAPAGARTVMLNVTGLNAELDGFVTVWPCGEPRPLASSLNLTPGLITPNLVVSKVGADGKVCLFTQRSADLIADITGTATAMVPYLPITPVRVLDTRPESAVNHDQPKPGQGAIVVVPVPRGIDSVALNITGVDGDGGFVTAFTCGQPIPTASNLNLTPGVISANLALVRVNQFTLPTQGAVCLFTQRPAHLVVDMVGAFSVDPSFALVGPDRVIDTRADSQIGYSGPKPTAGQVIEVAAPAGATAIAMNVTGLDTTETGFVTAYPCGEPRPLASNLNLTPGRITPNLAIIRVGANGRVCIFTQRSANLVVDLAATISG